MKRFTFRAASLVLGLLSVNVGFGALAQQTKVAESDKAMQVTVDEQGFHPASLSVKAEVPTKITFLRTTDKTCATSVLISTYNIKQELPLNKPVVVELTAQKPGEITFVCGVNMFKGKLVVTDK